MTLELREEPDYLFDQIISEYVEQRYLTSIIIPAYNEEQRIGPFLKSITESFSGNTEIIVVFDGNDNTPEIVKSFGNRVKLIQFSKRLGKGGAIIEGFKQAKGEVVGFVDADGAIPASEVKRLSSMVTDENPCVIGSRWTRTSRIESSEPILNVFAGRVFHYLVFLILGLKIKDTQCGIKFFHRSILNSLLKRITIKSRMIDVVLLFHVKLLKKNIREVGIRWKHVSGTKLPIMKIIPFMFATLVGLRLVHSDFLRQKTNSIVRFQFDLRYK